MRNILKIFLVVGLFLIFASGCASRAVETKEAPVQPIPVAVNPPPNAALPTDASVKAESEAAKIYKEGQSAYWLGNYTEAIFLFSRVKAVDANYKARSVETYQGLAAYRLLGKKSGGTKVFVEPTPENKPNSKILINDEEEWLNLVRETESILLDASTYLDKIQKSGEVPAEKLIDPNYYLKQARLSFERREYLGTIHYSYRIKETIMAAYNEVVEPERKLLGKMGDAPVTLNVTGLDLAAALQQIYSLTGVNIVLSAGVSGKVTMNVTEIPLRQVLDLMVDMNGLKYAEKDNVIRIMTPEEYEKTTAGLAMRNKKVYPIHYADAMAVAKVIRDAMGMEGVTADVRSNSVVADASSNQQAQDIDKLVKELDIPTSQVLIEAQLLEVTYTDDKSLGINFLLQSKMLGDVRLSGPSFGTVPSTLPSDAASIYFGLTHRDFSAIFNALASDGEVRLLQSPRIMAISGTPAVITTTEQFPYVTSTVSGGSATVAPTVTSVLNTKDVGTTFTVTPIIQGNRTVALNVNLVVDRVSETVDVPIISGNLVLSQKYPLVASRSTSQNIVLWDGESLVVGGIMSKNDIKSETRFPVLGKIPLLGNLFKRSSLSKRNTELILFLTPRIIQTYEEGRTLTREYEALPANKELEKGIIGQKWF
ncbi:MAG: secretin N-terminal domain-containing protein [Candidatus Ratteibacteria bacterium]|jgi:type IV pilus assembly protein PilQ